MPTKEELKMLQALPLSLKVRRTQQRIREWVSEYGTDGVYVSFSVGKDSTVLLHIVRGLYPDVPAVFVNTGLEFPEIQRFVKTFDNVEILRPKMMFPEVISKYGYPMISKNVSQAVSEARISYGKGKTDTVRQKRFRDEVYDGNGEPSPFNLTQWEPLLHVDFQISNKCCHVMKKGPAKSYEKHNGKVPFIGDIAGESRLRRNAWLKTGCNAFDGNRPRSNPIAFWTENDVLEYIKVNKLPLCEVYGEIVAVDSNGFEYDNAIGPCKYKTTGCYRTGCIFCGFGVHLDKARDNFTRLKRTHPRQYDYCMGGGGYGDDGIWRPTKDGLGMAHVIDELCRIYGNDFIKY